MRRQFTQFDGIVQPFLKLNQIVHNPGASKSRAALRFEELFANYMRDRLIRGAIIIKLFAHYSHRQKSVPLQKADTTMHGSRTQIDQYAIRFKNAMSFVKGMDHAPRGHSSQHPGEDYCIESLALVIESFR